MTVSVLDLRRGTTPFDYGFFPDAVTPYESDNSFMHRRRAIVLHTASQLGHLAFVIDAVLNHEAEHVYEYAGSHEWGDGQSFWDWYWDLDDLAARRRILLADVLGVGQTESVALLAVLAAVDLGWKPLLRHDCGDPVDIANRFILVLEPWKVGEGDGSAGNYDFLLPNFLAVAYKHRHLLSREADDRLTSRLLTQRGAFDIRRLIVTHGPFGVVSYPDTENHILQIEAARYLTNQLIGFDNDAPATAFLLGLLQGFLKNDFQEYNSRPYQGHTVRALSILYDHAWEPVRTAAGLVLEYLAAKFAVSSNAMRRYVPFRRQRPRTWSETGLFQDPETSRFVALTGLAWLLREASPNLDVVDGNIAVPAVLSSHRPHLVARDLMMNNEHKTYYQRFRHAGVEIFSSTPDFLITAGGIWVDAPFRIFGFANTDNISVPLATTLMPSRYGKDVGDLIRIPGHTEDEKKVNTGVAPGFACGISLRVPTRYYVARDPRSTANLMITDCTTLPTAEPHYLAARYDERAYIMPTWFVAVPATDLPFDAFIANVKAEAGEATVDLTGVNHLDIPPVPPVAFTPLGDLDDLNRWPIRGPVGQWADTSDWPLATGNVMNSEGHDGVIHIDHPTLPFMTAEGRRAIRISPGAISVRRESSRRGIDLKAGLRETLRRLAQTGIQSDGSVGRAYDVLTRRLTLDMRDATHPNRITPRFTAREVALMLGRGLTPTISIRTEAARRGIPLSGGLRIVVVELARRFRTGDSLTRAFEALVRRQPPTGAVSLRACFAYQRLCRDSDFRVSRLINGS